MNQEDYMRHALSLAEQGRGFTNPNPMVGAVIVKDGRIIGEGYHHRYGELHAERNALADCRKRGHNPSGADMYVTLEPCCHHGKTPPCTDAILDAGIARVVVGSRDENPLVGGKGISILKSRGVLVEEGVLEAECRNLNRIFFYYMRTGLPYVVMKYAMTMDGKIATATGASKWITGEPARESVHRMRHDLMGIMVGIGTVEKDDPMLNCRLPQTKNPIRIICDSTLRISPEARVVQTAADQRTIIATCSPDNPKAALLKEMHCEILPVPSLPCGRVDLKELMTLLGQMGIDSILLEGGAAMNWSALESGIVNEVHTYIAPTIFGGADAPSPVAGPGVLLPGDGFRLKPRCSRWIGTDLLIESEVQ